MTAEGLRVAVEGLCLAREGLRLAGFMKVCVVALQGGFLQGDFYRVVFHRVGWAMQLVHRMFHSWFMM